MIHISEAINILNDKEPHRVVFVSKSKGTNTLIEKGVATSSNFERRKFNIKSVDSGQTRWVYYVLLIEIDNKEVYL